MCGEEALEELLMELNNWFPATVREGAFRIAGGTLPVDGAARGQYIRISGSALNDGLHSYPLGGLADEEFTGEVSILSVPQSVVRLSQDIAEWREANKGALASPYDSESFGGYSYSRAKGGWQGVFARELSRWRRP